MLDQSIVMNGLIKVNHVEFLAQSKIFVLSNLSEVVRLVKLNRLLETIPQNYYQPLLASNMLESSIVSLCHQNRIDIQTSDNLLHLPIDYENSFRLCFDGVRIEAVGRINDKIVEFPYSTISFYWTKFNYKSSELEAEIDLTNLVLKVNTTT